MIETEDSRRKFEKATGRTLVTRVYRTEKAEEKPGGKTLIEVLVPGHVLGQMKEEDVAGQALCERCAGIMRAREALKKRRQRDRR
jgi:hypothetical protein